MKLVKNLFLLGFIGFIFNIYTYASVDIIKIPTQNFSMELNHQLNEFNELQNEPTNNEPIYGGFIKNRKTKDLIALRCIKAEPNSGCAYFQFVKIKKNDLDFPDRWEVINPNFNFRPEDIDNLAKIMRKKIQYRIDPYGSKLPNMPLFPFTFMVYTLADQNRNNKPLKYFVNSLYVISVPLDLAILPPTLVIGFSTWGVKKLIINIQANNVKKGLQYLTQAGKVKKISNTNFKTLITQIKNYSNLPY